MKHQLHIIPTQQIDNKKWNDRISKSSNGLIYAHSYYLDAMADHWHGLIIDDYASVMPLPWRKKYGIRYLYTPAFMQQLGLIGTETIDTASLIQAVYSFAGYGDHLFNFANHLIQNADTCEKSNNYILDLSAGYDSINSQYKTNLLRNLNRSKSGDLQYSFSENIDTAIDLHQQLQAQNIKHVTVEDYARFKKLVLFLHAQEQSIIRSVKNKTGEILSVALLLKDERRIYNIINATTEAGKHTNANHFLMDQIIQEFAGLNLLLDFEGSNIPGVKNFYEMFAAINQPYFHWHFNKLPWPLKLLKQ